MHRVERRQAGDDEVQGRNQRYRGKHDERGEKAERVRPPLLPPPIGYSRSYPPASASAPALGLRFSARGPVWDDAGNPQRTRLVFRQSFFLLPGLPELTPVACPTVCCLVPSIHR